MYSTCARSWTYRHHTHSHRVRGSYWLWSWGLARLMMWSLCSCFLSFARGLPAAKSCGPDYTPHLRPLEQPSFALKHTHTHPHMHAHTCMHTRTHAHTHTHNRYRITCLRYVILLTRSTGNTEHLCLLLFSLLFKFLCLFLLFLPPLVL